MHSNVVRYCASSNFFNKPEVIFSSRSRSFFGVLPVLNVELEITPSFECQNNRSFNYWTFASPNLKNEIFHRDSEVTVSVGYLGTENFL